MLFLNSLHLVIIFNSFDFYFLLNNEWWMEIVNDKFVENSKLAQLYFHIVFVLVKTRSLTESFCQYLYVTLKSKFFCCLSWWIIWTKKLNYCLCVCVKLIQFAPISKRKNPFPKRKMWMSFKIDSVTMCVLCDWMVEPIFMDQSGLFIIIIFINNSCILRITIEKFFQFRFNWKAMVAHVQIWFKQ